MPQIPKLQQGPRSQAKQQIPNPRQGPQGLTVASRMRKLSNTASSKVLWSSVFSSHKSPAAAGHRHRHRRTPLGKQTLPCCTRILYGSPILGKAEQHINGCDRQGRTPVCKPTLPYTYTDSAVGQETGKTQQQINRCERHSRTRLCKQALLYCTLLYRLGY